MKRTLTLVAVLAAAITLPAMALSWDQISGDWKHSRVRCRNSGENSPMMICRKRKATRKYWRARYRNATALQKRKLIVRSKIGSTRISTYH